MTQTATGQFDVDMNPLASSEHATAQQIGRMSLDKRFSGDLQGQSQGEMLTCFGAQPDSATYVAIERVTGSVHGRNGSFALYHVGVMNRGEQSLTIGIVPDSGSDQLTGIAGNLTIQIDNGVHYYTLNYSFAD
jgi:hypothetical protein